MGLIGGNPFYSGPSPLAAGVSSFGDNFLKTYLALQGNSREREAQALKEQMVAAQLEQMAIEKQAKQDELARSQGMRKGLMDLITPQEVTSMDFRNAPGPEAGLMTTEMVQPQLTQEGIMQAVLPYANDKDILGFLGTLNTKDKLEQGMQIQGLRSDMQMQMLREKIDAMRQEKALDRGTRITIAGMGQTAKEAKENTKRQNEYFKDTKAIDGMTYDLNRLAADAKELRDHPGLAGITGIRGAIPNIPGSAAADAQAKLNTLKSKTAFTTLQNMRAQSPTGGALGQTSDREIQLLQDNLAPLDKAQSINEIKSSLNKIIEYSTSSVGRLKKSYEMKWAEEAGGSEPAAGGEKTWKYKNGKWGMY